MIEGKPLVNTADARIVNSPFHTRTIFLTIPDNWHVSPFHGSRPEGLEWCTSYGFPLDHNDPDGLHTPRITFKVKAMTDYDEYQMVVEAANWVQRVMEPGSWLQRVLAEEQLENK